MKCRICDKPLVQVDEITYKEDCDCRSKLPQTDEEVFKYAGAMGCDFVVLGSYEPVEDEPVCDIVPLKDGGVAWQKDGHILRFASKEEAEFWRKAFEEAGF